MAAGNQGNGGHDGQAGSRCANGTTDTLPAGCTIAPWWWSGSSRRRGAGRFQDIDATNIEQILKLAAGSFQSQVGGAGRGLPVIIDKASSGGALQASLGDAGAVLGSLGKLFGR
jgi:hypothetical protein